MPPDQGAVLYTSLCFEGALAELSYYWGQLTPYPTKPAVIHRIAVTADRSLRLKRGDLEQLGVDFTRYHERDYRRCQEIGAAVSFLECDGLIVPSARWDTNNLVLFVENHRLKNELRVVSSEPVDWLQWAKGVGMIQDD